MARKFKNKRNAKIIKENKMKIFIWKRVENLNFRCYNKGGLMVCAESLEAARDTYKEHIQAQLNKIFVIGCNKTDYINNTLKAYLNSSVFTNEPDMMYKVSSKSKTEIFEFPQYF